LKFLASNWPGIVFFLGAWLVVPIFLSRAVVGADWVSIGIGYAIWIVLLALFGLLTYLGGTRFDEAFSWPIILSIFLTILAIPIIVGALRWTGLR